MRRVSYRPYIVLIALLLMLMSFPQKTSDRMRSAVVACLSPSWQGLNFLKTSIIRLLAIAPYGYKGASDKEVREVEVLRQENQTMHAQMENVRAYLLFEERIKDQYEKLKTLSHLAQGEGPSKEFFRRRSLELCRSLDLQLQALPAKVIFREPASWSSTLWLSVGEKNNQILGKTVVAKNSPVVVGSSIVGVVEYVGNTQSRVRLISDSSIIPSVRAQRGAMQNLQLLEHVEALLRGLEVREDLFANQEDAKVVFEKLGNIKGFLSQQIGDRYLAKGELYGSSAPLWRSHGQTLKGVGFNYDFSDADGPARDLRSGSSLDPMHPFEAIPILKVGDLLVTTGLDGVFPAGFRVGVVSKISCLKEGGCAYELEANAAAGNLSELTYVTVLPPIEFEKP